MTVKARCVCAFTTHQDSLLYIFKTRWSREKRLSLFEERERRTLYSRFLYRRCAMFIVKKITESIYKGYFIRRSNKKVERFVRSELDGN